MNHQKRALDPKLDPHDAKDEDTQVQSKEKGERNATINRYYYPRRQVFVHARRETLEAASARGLRIPYSFELDPREAVHGIRFIVISHDPSTAIMPVIAWLLNERIEDVESGNNR
ncbi:hypothetical protein CEP54_010797 [Fusarium duplospermum]|uniref:Uncharacterized protein n=1 Tax=Fusarium duplospermum TaxID=1325734 RepID=A0A428PI31_9HYPO|nr:hypothetical protein CEP54_010797 [Fusarium duplospermum]